VNRFIAYTCPAGGFFLLRDESMYRVDEGGTGTLSNLMSLILPQGDGLVHFLREQVSCDLVAFGLTASPLWPDEVFAADGWRDGQLADWCDGHPFERRLWATALRRGVAIGPPTAFGLSENQGFDGHTLALTLPELYPRKQWWWMLLGRRMMPFTSREREAAALVMRREFAFLNAPSEPGMGRIILGHDNRLLFADPATQLSWNTEPTVYQKLIDDFHMIVAQRWPDLEVGTPHDMVIRIGATPVWLCFRLEQTTEHPNGRRWWIKLRLLTSNELPVVGRVDDDRIGRALGFLHDRFHASPSLTECAAAVGLSAFHFHRVFCAALGISPKHYLQRKQIQVARWMLRTRGGGIREIAAATGFSSHGHFTSTFHRMVGVSPSQYRDQPFGK